MAGRPDAGRDARVLPRYLEAGSLRVAYVVPAAVLPHTPGEVRGALHERCFGDDGQALAWLAARSLRRRAMHRLSCARADHHLGFARAVP